MGRSKPIRRKYTRNYKKTFRVGKVSLGFVTVVLIFTATLLFLSQSNKIAVRGYEISELEKKIDELKKTNDKLKIESAKLQSVNLAQESIDKLKMVPVNQINYVNEKSGMAMR